MKLIKLQLSTNTFEEEATVLVMYHQTDGGKIKDKKFITRNVISFFGIIET